MRLTRWRTVCTAACLCTLLAGAALAQTTSSTPLRTQFNAQPSPEQDDATLHDVQLMGTRHGWAVGDRGVTWRTEDGGATWHFVPGPTVASLRSVCFLTDQIGWAVGGDVAPYTHSDFGVVLATQDGGRTWQVQAERTIPALHHVQFFGLESGIAVGESSAQFPTGVLVTEDGGTSWQSLPGEPQDGWRAAAFLDETAGYLGGPRGEHTAVGNRRVLKRTLSPFGLRGVHGVDLQPNGGGWLVGDGGLVLRTSTAGATWEEPPQPLPRGVRDFFDARCVTSQGAQVWIGGSPGAVVWHSADGGQNWEPQAIGSPAPVSGLHFSSPTRGCAVGAFGQIAITDDGGQTWRSIRGAGRRAALLTIHTAADRVPLRLVTRSSAENGYRAVTALAARHDVGPDGHIDNELDLRLRSATLSAGGCDIDLGWKLPIAAPGLDQNYDRLLSEWTLLTDGRLPDVMLGGLVAQLRTWRPSVVVIDEPRDGDASSRLLRQAIRHAVAQAADATRYPEQLQTGGLQPWSVSKVFVRLPEGKSGSPQLDPFEILPRHSQTLAMAAAEPISRLVGGDAATAPREGYRQIEPEPDPAAVPSREFFSGLNLSPGSDARRTLAPLTDFDYEQIEQLAQHQRNFASWSQRALDDQRLASQLIAQLQDIIGGSPSDQAALQLAALAEQYKERSQWQLAEETLIELAERYPREPAALEAMLWLLQLWTSQEIGWQRLRQVNSGRSQVTVKSEVTQLGAQQAESMINEGGPLDRVRELSNSADSPLLIQPVGGQLNFAGQGQRTAEAGRWHDQAMALIPTLERLDAAYAQSPEVQFTLAALLRHRGEYGPSDEIYRRFTNDSDPLWQRTAQGEAWILGGPVQSPKPVTRCRRVQVPPVLDGVLSDICWQEAQDMELTPPGSAAADGYVGSRGIDDAGALTDRGPHQEEQAIVMLAYDSRYLYFAASLPRAPELPADPPERAGRTYDADLDGYDQISLQIDIDRDYATYYRLDVDSRGRTRDACWIDQKWDPKWYVANDSEPRRWTVEAAIPLEELAPAPPGRGQTWAVAVVRTMPTIGVESWTHPAGSVPRPVSFGLLRFD